MRFQHCRLRGQGGSQLAPATPKRLPRQQQKLSRAAVHVTASIWQVHPAQHAQVVHRSALLVKLGQAEADHPKSDNHKEYSLHGYEGPREAIESVWQSFGMGAAEEYVCQLCEEKATEGQVEVKSDQDHPECPETVADSERKLQ